VLLHYPSTFTDYSVFEVLFLMGCLNRHPVFLTIVPLFYFTDTHCACSTVRRWRNGNAIEVWEAHKVAVQTVLKLPTGELFTGKSSDILYMNDFIGSCACILYFGALLSCNLFM
jgi:hypothetical protein